MAHSLLMEKNIICIQNNLSEYKNFHKKLILILV